MSTNLLITKNPELKRNLRRRTLSYQVRVGSFSLIIMLVVLFCVISLLYLTHFQQAATKGYRVSELEERRQELIAENEMNSVLIDKVRALHVIENHPKVQSMVKPGPAQIVYVKDEMAVAKN